MLNDTPPSKVLSISLPEDIADKLDAEASIEKRTRSNLVAKIISEYFEVKA